MIDPRAVVDPSAKISDGVSIGPFSVIGPDVEIDSGTWIGPHVVINGPTRLGKNNKIYQFASVGDAPQDKKYDDEPTRLEIGDDNVVRESCTINRGTVQGGGVTRVGDRNWIMAYVHIAHDCIVENDTILANNASLAGHSLVEDFSILGGFTLVHQFCRIGAHSFCAFGSGINRDIPPYVMVQGSPAKPRGINTEGLKRRAFSPESIRGIKKAYKALYREGLRLEDALLEVKKISESTPEADLMRVFIENSQRSIVR